MKKLALILACLLALTLCACGSGQSGNETTAPATTQAPETNAPETTSPATDAMETTAPATDAIETTAPISGEDAKEQALSCIDKPVEDLYALIGEPESADYAPSCMGPGEDGNLYYDGFTVYTYKEGEVETVRFVE